MDVVRLSIPLQQSDFLLTTEFPKNLADLLSLPSEEHTLPIFWYDHNMELAVPLHMGLTLPILHGDPPWPLGAFPRRIVLNSRRKRQSLCISHRQSRWITSDLAAALPLFDIPHGVTNCTNAIVVVVGNGNGEFIFKFHEQLNNVERVGVKAGERIDVKVGERSLGTDFVCGNGQILRHDVLDLPKQLG